VSKAFGSDELARYSRHILLKEVGGPGQKRLKASRVALVGLGGLGGPAGLYLSAAGIGHVTLIDPDTVDASNLQRQVQFQTDDLGQPKVEASARRFRALNPHTDYAPVHAALTPSNADALLAGHDLILDGTDDFSVRFAVNAAARRVGARLVSGAIGRWSGQVTSFDFRPGATSPCYRCLVPEPPPGGETCAEVGVIGALAGVIGSQMALEAIRQITGAGQDLVGRLWLFDGLSGQSRIVALARDPACPECGD
jgi:molybdopterin-synthase adenylyltransferase